MNTECTFTCGSWTVSFVLMLTVRMWLLYHRNTEDDAVKRKGRKNSDIRHAEKLKYPINTSCGSNKKPAAEYSQPRGQATLSPPRHPWQRDCFPLATYLMFLNNLYLLSYQRGGVWLSNTGGAHSQPRGPLSQPRCIPYSILSLLVFD